MKIIRVRKYISLGVLAIIGGLIIAGMPGGTAEAAYTDMPVRLPIDGEPGYDSDLHHQYINLTNQNTYSDIGGGDRVLNSYIRIYSASNNTTKSMELILVDRGIGITRACKGYQIYISVEKDNPLYSTDGDVTSAINSPISPNRCSVGDDENGNPQAFLAYRFSLPAGSLERSSTTGHKHNGSFLYEGNIRFRISPINGDKSSTFAIRVTSGNARLGYAKSPNPETAPSSDERPINIYPSAVGSGGYESASNPNGDLPVNQRPPKNHIVRHKFKPRCDYGAFGSNATFYWRDDDTAFASGNQNSEGQPNGLVASIVERNEATGSVTRIRYARDAPNNYSSDTDLIGDPLVFGRISIDVQPKRTYELKFDNVWGGNGITVWYPFDSGDFFLPCPDEPPPGEPPAAECNQFTHNVRKDDPTSNGASYYRITIFSRVGNYVASSPGENSIRSSRGDWKTFTQAPVYQTGWLPGYVTDSKGSHIAMGASASDAISSYNPNRNPTFILNFPEPAGPDWMVYVEKWDHTEDRNNNGTIDWQYRSFTNGVASCYSAACNIFVYNSDGLPANSVFGGQPFYAFVRLYNNGKDQLPITTRGYSLAATVPPSSAWAVGVHTPPPGGSFLPNGDPGNPASWPYLDIPLNDLPANADVNTRSLIAYPDYYGLFALGAQCSASVNTYMQFDITPNANITSMDEEDPRRVDYTVGGHNTGWPVTVNWDRQLYRKRPAAPNFTLDGVFSSSSSFGTISEARSYGNINNPLVPSLIQPGDEICAWSSIGPTNGWVGPGNDIRLASTKSPPDNPKEFCQTIADKPYLRTYGADVIAGSGFAVGDECAVNTGSSIRAFISNYATSPPNDRSGSGTQFAAIAYNEISGFTSASLRNNPPEIPVGLSFGNASPPGYYQGQETCASDFFHDHMYPEDNPNRENRSSLPGNRINPGLFPDDKQTVFSDTAPNYQLTIDGTASPYPNNHTIFVDGDLVITRDIVLADMTDPLAAASLAIVVKGNIYIDKQVTRLDGMYVAQPGDNPAKGKIFTCTTGDNPYSAAAGQALINDCDDQLIINGSFIAKDVEFLRTFKSLRDSAPRERSAPCAGTNDPANSCAAELFQFTPEIYLSPPPFYVPPPDLEFQSYGSLPPIL